MRSGVVLAAGLVVLAACTGSDPEQTAGSPTTTPPTGVATTPTTTPTTTAPPTESPAATGTVVKTADSQFGEVLFDGSGQAVYYFAKEAGTTPECYDDCAAAWPPVLTDGAPRAGGDVQASLLGTTERADGATQVTYAGRPLYYYAHEGKNVVECHNVDQFGGLWLAVTASGAPVG